VARAACEKPSATRNVSAANACSDHATTFSFVSRRLLAHGVLTPEQVARLVLLLTHKPSAAPFPSRHFPPTDRSTAVHPSSMALTSWNPLHSQLPSPARLPCSERPRPLDGARRLEQ